MTFWAKKDFFKKSPAFFYPRRRPGIFSPAGSAQGEKPCKQRTPKTGRSCKRKALLNRQLPKKAKSRQKEQRAGGGSKAAVPKRQQGGCPKAAAKRLSQSGSKAATESPLPSAKTGNQINRSAKTKRQKERPPFRAAAQAEFYL